MTQAEEASPERTPTIEFRFVADRFGFVPGSDQLRIGYARKAERALRSWVDTIEELFGEVTPALQAATDARILPQYPSWEPTERALGVLTEWLDGLPGGPRGTQSDSEPIVDLATQDAVEQLRIYLGVMKDWASTFRAGVWVASIGAIGSTEIEPSARLLQGLRSIAKVYEIDPLFMPDRVREEFGSLLPVPDSELSSKESRSRKKEPAKDEAGDGSSSTIVLGLDRLGSLIQQERSLAEAGEKAISYAKSVADFASNPDDLTAWLENLREDAKGYVQHAAVPESAIWDEIEDVYWQQWIWPTNGAVVRREELPKVSPFDLVYSTRYGSLPLLHWRGGNLSICQWSRLLDLARHRLRGAFDPPVRCAMANLGFAGGSRPANGASSDPHPIGMLVLHSETSPAWSWPVESQIRMFALMPPARAKQDRAAALYGRYELPEIDRPPPLTGRLPEIAILVAGFDEASVAPLQFVEVVNGKAAPKGIEDRYLASAAWHTAYFGFDAMPPAYRPFTSSPRDLADLVSRIERDYPDWFPIAGDSSANFLSGLILLLRKGLLLYWLQWRRMFAKLALFVRRVFYWTSRFISGERRSP